MSNHDLPDPVGRIDLTDLELDETTGGTSWPCVTATITISIELCSPTGTGCGTCNWGTRGCC